MKEKLRSASLLAMTILVLTDIHQVARGHGDLSAEQL
jgi:hypothetical protein